MYYPPPATAGGGNNAGTNIQLYTFLGGNSQRFGFIAVGNGAYRMVTAVTSGEKGVSVNGRYTTDGANIHQWTYNPNYTNDHWFLEEVEFGNGGTYRQINTQDPNCFGYAMFMDKVNINTLFWPNSHESEDFSDKFAGAIEGTGKTCRRISTFVSPIESDEYRVAIRVPNLLDGIHIYHVIYQLSDGTWAGKDDTAPSKHFGYGDPSHSPEMWENDAYSPQAGTIYFAVKR